MRSEFQLSVKAFNEKIGGVNPERPVSAKFDEETRVAARRQYSLILEEVMELAEALGLQPDGLTVGTLDTVAKTYREGSCDLVGIVDACADIMYVVQGLLCRLGVADLPVLQEVCRSNDTKFGPGHSINANGKLIKAPSYSPADFVAVLTQLREGNG